METPASDKGRLNRQAVASLESSTEGNPAGVSAETPGKPAASSELASKNISQESRSLAEGKPDARARENPEGNPEKRLVLRLRRLLEQRGALFHYDEETWLASLSSLLDRGFSEKEIEVAMEFSQEDDYWNGGVADLPDLERHADTIVQQARRWYNGRLPKANATRSQKSVPRRDGPYPPPRERTVDDWYEIHRDLVETPQQAAAQGKHPSEGWSDDEVREYANDCYEGAR